MENKIKIKSDSLTFFQLLTLVIFTLKCLNYLPNVNSYMLGILIFFAIIQDIARG